MSYERLGDLEDKARDRAAALARYEQSLPIVRALAARFPDHPGFAKDLAITQRRLKALRSSQ